MPLASMVRILLMGEICVETLEFGAHLVKEHHIHLMIDEAIHLEDTSRFYNAFLADPLFQQLHD